MFIMFNRKYQSKNVLMSAEKCMTKKRENLLTVCFLWSIASDDWSFYKNGRWSRL